MQWTLSILTTLYLKYLTVSNRNLSQMSIYVTLNPLFVIFTTSLYLEYIPISNKYFAPCRSSDEGRARRAMAPTFSEIILCQRCFPTNSLLCCSPKHSKPFSPRHSQNLVGGPALADFSLSILSFFILGKFYTTK